MNIYIFKVMLYCYVIIICSVLNIYIINVYMYILYI